MLARDTFAWIIRDDLSGQVDIYKLDEEGMPGDRVMALSPDGRYLLATAFEGSVLTVYKIGDDGDLGVVGSRDWDRKIADLIAR